MLYGAPTAGDAKLHDEAVAALCSVLRLEMTTHGHEAPRQLINSLFNLLHPSMHYPTSPPPANSNNSSSPSANVGEEQLHRIIISLLGRITCALDDPKVHVLSVPLQFYSKFHSILLKFIFNFVSILFQFNSILLQFCFNFVLILFICFRSPK